MILGYESALSVKSEKIYRVRYFKLKHTIFLLTPPPQNNTQNPADSEWQIEKKVLRWKGQNVSIENRWQTPGIDSWVLSLNWC